MKNSCILAAALASTTTLAMASPTSGLEKMMTDKIMSYAGLNEETTSVDIAGEEAETPRVKTFGYENASASTNGLLGYGIGLNADLGWSYELPLYNQDEYLVSRQRVSAFGGGRQYLSLTFYVVRLTLFLDLWVAKFTADSYMRYDIVNHDNDMCAAGQWLLDVARASLLFQLDVNECIWGLVGSITSDTDDCSWGTYYIN